MNNTDRFKSLYDNISDYAWNKALKTIGGDALHDAWWNTVETTEKTMGKAMRIAGMPHTQVDIDAVYIQLRMML